MDNSCSTYSSSAPGKSPAILDPCPQCNADAWCHQTLKQTTAKGTPNPFYLKWWTKCPSCGFSRNYDTPPESAAKSNKRTFDQMLTSPTDVPASLSVSAQLVSIAAKLDMIIDTLTAMNVANPSILPKTVTPTPTLNK